MALANHVVGQGNLLQWGLVHGLAHAHAPGLYNSLMAPSLTGPSLALLLLLGAMEPLDTGPVEPTLAMVKPLGAGLLVALNGHLQVRKGHNGICHS